MARTKSSERRIRVGWKQQPWWNQEQRAAYSCSFALDRNNRRMPTRIFTNAMPTFIRGHSRRFVAIRVGWKQQRSQNQEPRAARFRSTKGAEVDSPGCCELQASEAWVCAKGWKREPRRMPGPREKEAPRPGIVGKVAACCYRASINHQTLPCRGLAPPSRWVITGGGAIASLNRQGRASLTTNRHAATEPIFNLAPKTRESSRLSLTFCSR